MPSLRSTSGLLVILAVCATGCALFQRGEPRQEPVHLRVTAGPRLNPDEHGVSLPTAVQAYQLKSGQKFAALELTDLLRDPKGLLGEDLLGLEELQLEPGRTVERTFARAKGALFVGVVAVVRRPAGGAWRQVVELPEGPADLGFAIEEYRIQRR